MPSHEKQYVGYWLRREAHEAGAGQSSAQECACLRQQLSVALAQRDALRHEMVSLLAGLGFGQTGSWFPRLFRGLLRRKHRFGLIALNDLVPQQGQIRTWGVIGPDPQFAMLPFGGSYPSGWVLLRSRLRWRGEEGRETKLYLDVGGGYSEERVLRIPVSLNGTVLELIYLPPGVCGLRWDPVDVHGQLQQDPIEMIEVGLLELLYRMERRCAWAMRTFPPAQVEHVGLTWRRFLREPVAAYQAAALLRERTTRTSNAATYDAWIARCEKPGEYGREQVVEAIRRMKRQPLVSVMMPTFNTPEKYLRSAIESVRRQSYPNWELCIADDASTQPHVRAVLHDYARDDARIRVVFRTQNGHISRASNSALELVRGQYVALLDHDDELAEHALFHVVHALDRVADAKVIYSDEDKIDADGRRSDPHFKPDWNPDLLRSQNYVSHLGVYSTELVRKVGGFRVGLEGSQDHDLLLRCVANCSDREIVHIPLVLYHWRVLEGSTALDPGQKSYTQQAGIRAVADYLAMSGVQAQVEPGLVPNAYRVRYTIPDPQPLVSLLVPTRDRLHLVRTCVESILQKTTYRSFEVLILDNQSEAAETLAWLAQIGRDPRVRVLRYDYPFNFSAINNFGVRHARGEIVGLVNNDIEVISPDWLTEMGSHACRSEIGCVGAKLYYDDDTIQHAGIILGVGGVAGHSHKHFPKRMPGYFSRLMLVQNLSAVTAACLLVRKKIYLAVGGLDEKNLRVAFNDVDFCLKVRVAGFRNIWTPYAELFHHESVSRGAEDTPEKQARFAAEVRYMQKTWGEILKRDPAYNPNLTLAHENFAINADCDVAQTGT